MHAGKNELNAEFIVHLLGVVFFNLRYSFSTSIFEAFYIINRNCVLVRSSKLFGFLTINLNLVSK